MRRQFGWTAKFAGLYILIAGISLGPLFAVGGLTDTTFSVAMVTALALIPVTAILFPLIARSKPGRSQDAAYSAPQQTEAGPQPGRQTFEFAFAAWNGIDSAQAVQRLSARLNALGIEHRYARTIFVRDGDVRWEVAPVSGALRIGGWVEAPDSRERMMVMAAIEEFLIEELGIRLERLAA